MIAVTHYSPELVTSDRNDLDQRRVAAAEIAETLIEVLTPHTQHDSAIYDANMDAVTDLYLRTVITTDVRFFEAHLLGSIPREDALAAARVYVRKAAMRRLCNAKNGRTESIDALALDPPVEDNVQANIAASEAMKHVESDLSTSDIQVLRMRCENYTLAEIGYLCQRSTSWAAWRWSEICNKARRLSLSMDWQKSAEN